MLRLYHCPRSRSMRTVDARAYLERISARPAFQAALADAKLAGVADDR